ncbi:MAG: ribosomal-protein-alanine N-acetyltransferase [Proteobacteria bacterium]|nr:MAG: ribosomal-protein-alanine N-acetyltransferase [Pseudomonadota bacterium]
MGSLLSLHPMTESDLDTVMAVEKRAYPYPWTKGIFSDCLRHNYLCLLHAKQGKLLAYCVLMLSLDELHILNLTVNPNHQKQGLGTRLLYTVEKIAQELNARECFLEVRPSNRAAICLYTKQGFNEIGLRRNYYPAKHGREDAVLMGKTLIDS